MKAYSPISPVEKPETSVDGTVAEGLDSIRSPEDPSMSCGRDDPWIEGLPSTWY